jgi:CubicO group peptidase (beta-lactamase class C family)
VEVSHAPDLVVFLPEAPAPISLPKGWSVDEAVAALTLVAPEGDIRVSFVTLPATSEAADDALAAWRAIDAGFALPVLNAAEGPPSDGWDGAAQIVYGTPAVESRSAMAIVRRLGDRSFVNLLWGTKAGLSRRMAQIGEVIKAWRPKGLKKTDLDAREPLAWSDRESGALHAFMSAAMSDAKIPGAAIALVQNGAVVFAEGFGVTSLDDPQPVTAETRFMIGSTTKSLTTLMMARLVEAGRFAWSTPVTELLPGFALADPEVTAKLEMRHTVSAGTGMPRRDTELVFRTRGVMAADRMAEMREMLPTTGFGETFQYSNHLVAAGGFAAARAFSADGSLEEAYERAMRELVFEPLGMTRTTLPPRNGTHDDEAAPHSLDFAGDAVTIDPGLERFADSVAPAGAAWSTAPDVARYVLLELAGGAAPEVRRAAQTRIDGDSSYGLGLFMTKEQGLALIGHGGNTFGFSADMWFLPGKNLGAVVLTNKYLANAFLAAVKQRIFELLFAAPPTAEQMIASIAKAASALVESKRKRIATDAAAAAWLATFAGEYRSKELGPARIEPSASGYRAQFESLTSALGVETQPNGGKLLVLIDPPFSGLRLQPSADGRELIHDAAQTKYAFVRVT